MISVELQSNTENIENNKVDDYEVRHKTNIYVRMITS